MKRTILPKKVTLAEYLIIRYYRIRQFFMWLFNNGDDGSDGE